jgi:glutamate 5-kinase
MHGSIVVTAAAGRALRQGHAAVLAGDVLGCAGDFRAGDSVYVVVRGADGGQGVIARGAIRCPAIMLPVKGASPAASSVADHPRDSLVVMAEQDLQLLWRAASEAGK